MNEELRNSILDMDATDMKHAILNRKFTSYEAVETYINHIKYINPEINAVVEDRFSTALLEAKNIDEKITNPIGPLHGVPISVKEAFHVQGMRTTGGLVQLQDLIAKKDATIINKLKTAGAIILGKTNTPSLCFAQETDNKLYGRTNNPWDTSRTAGGSSGGEGALLASGGAAVGIGSDIGGSIRFPSHFNGVIGFKPGKFQVSSHGHYPPIFNPLQERMLGCGPMGKSVRDMELMYSIIANHKYEERQLSDFIIEMLPTTIDYPLSAESKSHVQKVKQFLSSSSQVNEGIPPMFDESAQLWQEIMSIDGAQSVKSVAFANDRVNLYLEYIKEITTKKSQVHHYLTWALLGANLFKPSSKRLEDIKTIVQEGDKILEDYLNKRLLIFPVYHTGAPKHGTVFQEIFSIRKTYLNYIPFISYANVWGLPCLVIPVGTDENRMPISIQIMSSIGNEDAIFNLGKHVEKQFRGYVRKV
ncbi:amidase [Ornithinibacillus sp. L9]|uniref:Amidase n=1 Tax=Ornithinibacillus caprae TaxID=2678566 RepID=A0A6N8FQU0_9BACI|nr:amidase [Ornithinibacillus caprae]MUK90008.1 amidase [Ornithinibacillus caprae]